MKMPTNKVGTNLCGNSCTIVRLSLPLTLIMTIKGSFVVAPIKYLKVLKKVSYRAIKQMIEML